MGPFQIAAIVAGPFVGSCLGLLSLRLPAGRPVAVARSGCDGCGRALGVTDLVPLASYLALRGRCRTCGATIPRRYPLLELGCLGLALWAVLMVPGPLGLVSAALGWWLLLIALIDGEHMWLPDRLTLPLGAAGLAATALWMPDRFVGHAIGALAGFLTLWLVAAAYRRWRGREGLGGGDPRLLGAGGCWVGWDGLPSVLLWGAAGGLAAVAVAFVCGRRWRGDDALPFGTFLCAGIWLTWLHGPLTISM